MSFSDVHESIVCPEQLNCLLSFRKILQLPQIIFVFQHFCVFEPFPTMTVWFWDPSFHTEGLICNYYRRFKRSLMLQKEKTCIISRGWKLLNRMKMCTVFLFCLNIIFFYYYYCPSEVTEDTYMFPRRQNKLNLPWSSNSKRFHPPTLNASTIIFSCGLYVNIFYVKYLIQVSIK